jgi:hypothetical protein
VVSFCQGFKELIQFILQTAFAKVQQQGNERGQGQCAIAAKVSFFATGLFEEFFRVNKFIYTGISRLK